MSNEVTQTVRVELKTVGFIALETGSTHIYTQKNNKRRVERQAKEKLDAEIQERVKAKLAEMNERYAKRKLEELQNKFAKH